ncbi:hypothetical protein OHB41_50665 [Streptomyces sp. NBC_01571]|uniref:hypothetical protein n=1 Tax=Streptomyces sp. NBC_01571 TaxID=2975883 RepID=UPI00225B94AA|nr:hypothetical protein [Streptomyces sp. NBC_01571]MCX4581223.1 hypothetical protein [Streptomyces sp. NBC_01571]
MSDPEPLRNPGLPKTAPARVSFPMERWILAPRTTWQARRIAADFGPGMDAGTAWMMARLQRHSDEYPYMVRPLDGDQTS